MSTMGLMEGAVSAAFALRHGPAQSEAATLDNRQALDQFLAGVERRALRMAEYATGNIEDALDLVQDAMLKLAQSYSHRPPQEWAALFHTILHSRIMDWHRRSRVRSRWRTWLGSPRDGDDARDLIQSLPDPHPSGPVEGVSDEELAAALERAVRGLPPRQQQAFLLRAWEGLSVAQTAHAMRCSQGSVKTHYSRAVHTLRRRLQDHWQ